MIQIQNLFKFLVILYCLNTINGATDQDLCNLCPPGQSSDHIFCLFPNPGPADKWGCREVDVSITTDEFRDKVLHWHNNYRNKFAEGSWKGNDGDPYSQPTGFPRAANMRLLSYDYQLEKLAKRNVQNCFNDHEKCRAVERFTYGQNLGFMANSAKDHVPKDSEGTWEAWVGEMKDYTKPEDVVVGNGQHKGVVNHFIATTWADTRVLGCAQANSYDGSYYRIDVVCNYGPMGVWSGEPMYLTGTPGSKCTEGTKAGFNSTFPNLCGGVNQSDVPFADRAIVNSCVNVKCDFGNILFWLACGKLFKRFF